MSDQVECQLGEFTFYKVESQQLWTGEIILPTVSLKSLVSDEVLKSLKEIRYELFIDFLKDNTIDWFNGKCLESFKILSKAHFTANDITFEYSPITVRYYGGHEFELGYHLEFNSETNINSTGIWYAHFDGISLIGIRVEF